MVYIYIFIYIYVYGYYIYIYYIPMYRQMYTYVYLTIQQSTVPYSTIQYTYHTNPIQWNRIELYYITVHCRTLRYVILHYTDMTRFNVSMVLTHAACRDDGIAASEELAHVVESAAILSLA